jgi:hypothetical protein
MKSMSALKEEIDSLLPRERQELLKYISARMATERFQKTSDSFPMEGAWADEAESEAQYAIPEFNYRSSSLRQEDKKTPDDDLL